MAVKGDNFDGHDFISEVQDKGAVGILELEDLFELAAKKIKRFSPIVIVITGSYGKTTTKEMISKVLSSRFKVCQTSANFNTPLGVALESVNKLRSQHQFLIAEVGMDRLGEIASTCSFLGPRIGVVTSVGEMHLAKLKTIRNIKRAKSELLAALPDNGVAVLNAEDPYVCEIAEVFRGEKIWYKANDLCGLKLKLLGEANYSNAAAAYAIGKYFGIPRSEIFEGLKVLKPKKGRLALLSGKRGFKIIDDTYNAGPRSMRNALVVLHDFPAKRRIAVLGDMFELGWKEKEAYRSVAAQAAKVADVFVPIGERMNSAVRKLAVPTMDISQLQLKEGDAVLVKGSRAMKMERLMKDLLLR